MRWVWSRLWSFRARGTRVSRVHHAGNISALAIGAILIGQTTYVPTYAQRVVGVGAVVAGLAMATMTVGWPISATLAPRIYLRIGYRPTALPGGTITVVGSLLFALFVGAGSGIWHVGAAGFVLGIGLGFISVSTVGWGDAASSQARTYSSGRSAAP